VNRFANKYFVIHDVIKSADIVRIITVEQNISIHSFQFNIRKIRGWKFNKHWVSKETERYLWNPEVAEYIHNTPPVLVIQS